MSAIPLMRRRASAMHDWPCVWQWRRPLCFSHVFTDALTSSYRSVFCQTVHWMPPLLLIVYS